MEDNYFESETMIMPIVLEKEYNLFLNRLKEFLPDHHDQFVLIKGKDVVGFYDSYETALTEGLKRFGNVPFFIKEVKEEEDVHFFHQGIVF